MEEDTVAVGGDEVIDNNSGLCFRPSDGVEGQGVSVGEWGGLGFSLIGCLVCSSGADWPLDCALTSQMLQFSNLWRRLLKY